jgi:adenosylmethionine-8-amino-7-oxononanoate aminotransferase
MAMNELLISDKQNIWHPFTPLADGSDPILIKSAKGVNLYTHDGKKIIDAISSWWVNIHGHSNPHIAQAVARQAEQLEHVIFAGFTHEPAITLSKNLMTILPVNQKKIFFSDDGSTAVEVGIKLALQYWFNLGIQKSKCISIRGAYHGDTFGSMSVGDRSIFSDPFTGHLFKTEFIDFPEKGNADAVFEQFKKYIDQDDIAFFIFEPLVQGAAGMRMYDEDILDDMIDYARNKSVLCIADEVFTGFGRTGKLFASDYLKNKPDIMALSKGITGGTMPLGVTACSEQIVNAFKTSDFTKTFFHGHSFTANPIACAAANASFELLMHPSCTQKIEMIAIEHKKQVQRWKTLPQVSNVRSRGTILAIELSTQYESSYANEIRKKIYPYFLQRGILLRPLGNIIYILPPYVINQEELSYIYSCVEEFLEKEFIS